MSTDVTLNGVGYMVLPGSYKADATTITKIEETVIPGDEGQEGSPAIPAELPPSQRYGRHVVSSLGARGAVAGGLGGLLPWVGPVWRPPFPIGAAGVGPPPLAEVRTGTITAASGRVGIGTRNFGFLASGTTQANLYRWTTEAIIVRRTGMGAAAVGMAARGNRDIFVAFGSAQGVGRWEDVPGTWTSDALNGGATATHIAMLGDRPVTVPHDDPGRVHVWNSNLSTSASYPLSGAVLALGDAGDGILVATDNRWYIIEEADGAPFQVRATSRPTDIASTVHLATYRGVAYASVDGHLWRRSSFTGSWQPVDAPGRVGALVASGRWLYARVDNDYGASGWWVFDGEAWFWINTVSQMFPGPAGHVGATMNGSTEFFTVDESDPDNAAKFATTYQAATALQGASIARNKTWSQIGAEFHRSDNEEVGSATARLQYSTDGGRTWTNAGSAQNVNVEHHRITATINVTCRVLLVRVNVTISAGLAPILAALWGDWRVTDADGGADAVPAVPAVKPTPDKVETTRTPALYRRWRFTVLAQDGLVDRNGALLGLSASQIRSTLWARLNQTSSFTDLDGTVHNEVTLTNIEEEWPSPADAAANLSTRLKLTIIEGDQTV